MAQKLSFEEIKGLYQNETREILDIEVRKVGKQGQKTTYIKYKCLVDRYEDWMSISNMKGGKGCPKCANIKNGKSKGLTLEEVKLKLKEINLNIEILSDEYINANTKLKCRCLIDNHIWYPTWGNLSQGKGCPVCSGNVLHETNKLSAVRPDLIKYLRNKSDAENNFPSSKVKIECKCPICGTEKPMVLNNLSIKGFSCDKCSDNISIPEKFMFGILKYIDIEFETQKVFDWAKNKKYDFYIPSLNMIIETHGIQHYEEGGKNSKFKKTLKEEQENDLLKHNLAIENGISSENYIVVDCRFSELEWLKENCARQLDNKFNLMEIDWNALFIKSQKSIVPKIWDAWNNRNYGESTEYFANLFKISRITLTGYLKVGTKLGKCVYDSNKERKISFRKNTCNFKIYAKDHSEEKLDSMFGF